MKKLLSLVIAVAMLVPCMYTSLPASAEEIDVDESSESEIYGDFEYTVSDDDTVKIIRYTGSDEDVTVPDTINGMAVTSIGGDAFEECTPLTKIIIPDGVTRIGEWAFKGCTSLTEVIIPDSVTVIDQFAFSDCSSLKSVTIPDGVTIISAYVFSDCISLTEVTIPDGVESILDAAFLGCGSLKEVTFPNSLISIGDSAFRGCDSLTSIKISDSVAYIESSAFSHCELLESINVDENNEDYSSIDGVLFNKSQTEFITCPAGKTGEYEIPDSVTSIFEQAFGGCSSLTEITIPDGVTSIGWDAFDECISLAKITIPNGLTNIEGYTFSNCSSLTEIVIPSSVTFIDDFAFSDCSSLSDVYYTVSEEQWNAISIGSDGNDYLTNAAIHYNYEMQVNEDADTEEVEETAEVPVATVNNLAKTAIWAVIGLCIIIAVLIVYRKKRNNK